jgi:hypothetical protein
MRGKCRVPAPPFVLYIKCRTELQIAVISSYSTAEGVGSDNLKE